MTLPCALKAAVVGGQPPEDQVQFTHSIQFCYVFFTNMEMGKKVSVFRQFFLTVSLDYPTCTFLWRKDSLVPNVIFELRVDSEILVLRRYFR